MDLRYQPFSNGWIHGYQGYMGVIWGGYMANYPWITSLYGKIISILCETYQGYRGQLSMDHIFGNLSRLYPWKKQSIALGKKYMGNLMIKTSYLDKDYQGYAYMEQVLHKVGEMGRISRLLQFGYVYGLFLTQTQLQQETVTTTLIMPQLATVTGPLAEFWRTSGMHSKMITLLSVAAILVTIGYHTHYAHMKNAWHN